MFGFVSDLLLIDEPKVYPIAFLSTVWNVPQCTNQHKNIPKLPSSSTGTGTVFESAERIGDPSAVRSAIGERVLQRSAAVCTGHAGMYAASNHRHSNVLP